MAVPFLVGARGVPTVSRTTRRAVLGCRPGHGDQAPGAPPVTALHCWRDLGDRPSSMMIETTKDARVLGSDD